MNGVQCKRVGGKFLCNTIIYSCVHMCGSAHGHGCVVDGSGVME